MPNVLMPAECDAVARALEMRLAQQMIHRVALQQLSARRCQARVFADLEQIALASTGPDDAFDDLPAILLAENASASRRRD